MLNELSQVADSLERLGTVAPSRHPRINPMGKNRELLVVRWTRKANRPHRSSSRGNRRKLVPRRAWFSRFEFSWLQHPNAASTT